MNDVHPVRNAAIGPYASRMYTYSPPACGRIAPSSAYAIAPAKASAPPTAHAPSSAEGRGTSCATMTGTKKIPPPITLEITIAAASRWPRRRWRPPGPGLTDLTELLRDELPRKVVLPDLDPLRRAVLGKNVDAHVLEVGILQDVRARLRRVARVAGGDLVGEQRGLIAVELYALREHR